MMILMVVAFIKAKNTFMYRNIYIFACAPRGESNLYGLLDVERCGGHTYRIGEFKRKKTRNQTRRN